MSTRSTILAAVDAYAAQDLDGAMAHCADNVCFRLQSEGRGGSWRIDCHDKPAFIDALRVINTDFEITRYELVEMIVDGSRAATRTAIDLRNRVTGEVLLTELADFWTVENDRIVSIQEFADTAAIGENRSGATPAT